MFDLVIADTPSAELLGSPTPSQWFKDTYPEHESKVLSVYAEHGIDISVWSLASISERTNYVYMAMHNKQCWQRLNLDAAMDMTTAYSGEKVHPKVASRFQEIFPYSHKQFFFITKGEDWWDGEPFFLVHNADTFMQWARYDIACKTPEVLSYGVQRQRGRPRDEAKHRAKAESKVRYNEWLEQCSEYRAAITMKKAEVAEARLMVEQKRLELLELEMRGAPTRPA